MTARKPPFDGRCRADPELQMIRAIGASPDMHMLVWAATKAQELL